MAAALHKAHPSGPEAIVPACDRCGHRHRAGDSGGQALQGIGKGWGVISAHQPLISTGDHPIRSWPGVHGSSSPVLLRAQRYNHGHPRAGELLGERICRNIHWTILA